MSGTERGQPEHIAAGPRTLSPREIECLLWSALGKRTKQIAELLDIAPATVNEYVAAALKKLDARSRAQAVAILLKSRQGSGLGWPDPAGESSKHSSRKAGHS